ncbi:MAG: class II glutamine amidotransferase [Candidatus Roizmanbacteria bacterium]|nr:MAG: class II glutamine amidotransferase [Candidatus Roizmanbacteria bacterium]
MSEKQCALSMVEYGKPKEECGVFAFSFPHPAFTQEIIPLTLTGLLENQHRGEESAGIATINNGRILPIFKGMGLVRNLYQEYKRIEEKTEIKTVGQIAISHCRYSTTGEPHINNAGPFMTETSQGQVTISHNGNIINAKKLKEELESKGYEFKGTSDSEIISSLIADAPGQIWSDKISYALNQMEGSFSLAIATTGLDDPHGCLYAARDSFGNRPLSYAEFEKDGIKGYAVSSESPAFDSLDISYQSEIEPGQLIKFTQDGPQIMQFNKNTHESLCGLEIAYLMRPDSRIKGVQLYAIRNHLGRTLAHLYPPPRTIDYVTNVPESARPLAEGYAYALSKIWGIHVQNVETMLKNRYGTLNGAFRGFMNPDQSERDNVADKYHPFDNLVGANIVELDDSIISGTTTKGMMRTISRKVGINHNQGVKEVHLRIPFPPVVGPCGGLGVDINAERPLVARDLQKELLAYSLGVTSLAYLTPEQFRQAVNEAVGREVGLCLGCTDGKYPVNVFSADKAVLERR